MLRLPLLRALRGLPLADPPADPPALLPVVRRLRRRPAGARLGTGGPGPAHRGRRPARGEAGGAADAADRGGARPAARSGTAGWPSACSACSPGWPLWSDWLILPYLAVAGLALVWAARRELLGWPGVLLVAGFAVGVAPMIRDNLRAPPGEDSLSVFREISTKAGPTPPWSRAAARRAAGGGAAGRRALPGGRLRPLAAVVRAALPGAAGGRRRARRASRTAGPRAPRAASGSGRWCSSRWSPARR